MNVEKKTLKPDLSAEKEDVECEELSKSEVVEEHTPVTLKVGNAVYNTTKEILLSRDDNSFFHIQFSGRWSLDQGNSEKELKVEIKERCGETFADVLYYLRFGDIPRDPMTRAPFLDESSLEKLKAEAEFYLLPNLAKLCESGPLPLFIVTNSDDSDPREIMVHHFVSYEDARKFHNDMVDSCGESIGPPEISQGGSRDRVRCRCSNVEDGGQVIVTEKRNVDEKAGLEEIEILHEEDEHHPIHITLKIAHPFTPVHGQVVSHHAS